ncbi:hypothetical protein QQ045_008914 [Rhodiola kirilowii]
MDHGYRATTITAVLAFLLFTSVPSALSLIIQQSNQIEMIAAASRSNGRREVRRMMGPGSHPPNCRSKCGPCAPCRPVHVPVRPGLSKPLDYYPEAWRCKCGNSLFIP